MTTRSSAATTYGESDDELASPARSNKVDFNANIEEMTASDNDQYEVDDDPSDTARSRVRPDTADSADSAADDGTLIEQLEQLNEELDMGEKLLKHKADPAVVLNATKISDSLAVLIGHTPSSQQQHNAEHHMFANAQRQDFRHGYDSRHQQSNVTGNSVRFR